MTACGNGLSNPAAASRHEYALKFTPEGGRVHIRAEPVDGQVEISVSDTGVGIAPEDREAIFEEFRRVGTAEKEVEDTSGTHSGRPVRRANLA
jgi:signal transduction histidine kinase